MKISIISDDFTGANDVGIQVKEYGVKVCSTININKNSCDVNVISTETRNAKEEEAYNKIKKTFIKLKSNGFDKFYKKIDSTLRGNIKSEIDAILENLEDEEQICLVAAFPKMGRKILNGIHYLWDEPLIKTEFAKDPVAPVKDGNLLSRIGNKKKELIKHFKLDDIRSEGFAKEIRESKNKILIFDSEVEEDLEKISKILVNEKKDKYVVGSAGAIEYLMKYWGYKKSKVLIVSGSCSNKSIKQINYFEIKYKNSLDIINLDVFKRENLKLDLKKDILIKSLRKREEMDYVLEKYKINGIDKKEATNIISDYIAKETIKIVKKYNITKIIILGGETSLKIIKSLNINGLEIRFKIDTGVVISESFNKKYMIITKPGAFGEEDVLERGYNVLKSV
ncbi:four-carbon acid sugar kinase family protein [Haliovirga abyssi]|uniref:Four-carbon acid sugar kinase family protein n=1 Tax=Haliovirga abyssi TaxID=2996794 RepID=A0AAU9D1J2_9FUSO|nr:four-carbon acid sugar kinase family protein [Haliovirga abyssi]BDU49856.1 hypothetical protein HLVA_04250 [Haliovirga abyssi]